METTLLTVTVEVFQDGSPDAAQVEAEHLAVKRNPELRAVASRFAYAHPGNRDGRWVGIEVDLAA
jgi:hypothetical protein